MLALGPAALALTACGTTTIDSGKVEQLVRDSAASPKPERVQCPDGVPAHKGDVFRCRLFYARGKQATLTVHIQDDGGRVSFAPSDLHAGG